MADDSQPIKYVYADSTSRDVTLYPDGANYTLHLTSPLHSIVQVDLVAAKVPNTMYNITNGSNVLIFSNTFTGATTNVSIATGYYSAPGLVVALVSSAASVFCMEFLQDEGRYIFSSNVNFTIQATTSEMQKVLGLETGTISSFYSSSSPIYMNDTTYNGRWLLKSSKIINLSNNEYVFLDIEEFRTTSVIDAKKLVGGTTEGATIRSTFGQIPMDVPSGSIKNYKETTDYNQYVQFTTPIPKIQRLTIRWIDHNGRLLDFQSFNNNAFTLRVHCEYREPPPPPPPLQDVQIQRIVDAMMHAPPPPKPEEPKRAFGRWVLLVLIIGFVAAYVAYVRLLRPLVERIMEAKSAPPAPPVHNFKLY